MKKYGDMICGITGMTVAVVMLILSVQIGMKEGNAIGAAFLPEIVGVIILVFSAVLAWRGWQSSKSYVETAADYPANETGVWMMMALCLVYAAALKPIGFIISSGVFLFAALCLMTKKEKTNYVRLAVITVVAVMAIYLIFTQFFGIRLPHGIL